MVLSPTYIFLKLFSVLRAFTLKDCKHKFIGKFRINSLAAKSLLHQMFSRFYAKYSKVRK